LRSLFTGPDGPGLPNEGTPDGRLRAALLPHMDFPRGGATYAWGFKEVFEHTNARLFVVIGTSHYSRERFTLTRQHFRTPLGVVPTDTAFVDRLAELYGPGLFDDPFAHIWEHSIELEVVFLQYLYENRRPIRIVPLVVGSFHDCVASGTEPAEMDDIRRMAAALRQVEAEVGEPVCTIISGDLAHIGPEFGDPVRVHEKQLAHCRAQDERLLTHAAAADAAGYFQVIQAENDDRRICGLPPTYVALEAVRPSAGKLLHYNQHVHPRGNECVSFASMAFYP
jgi:AmmeMemoRadiSam system protein B